MAPTKVSEPGYLAGGGAVTLAWLRLQLHLKYRLLVTYHLMTYMYWDMC